MNISSRVLNNWKNKQLLPEESEDEFSGNYKEISEEEVNIRKKNKFSFVGLVYLLMLQDLRGFGLSIEKLKKVKGVLFKTIDSFDILKQVKLDDIVKAHKRVGMDERFTQFLVDNYDNLDELNKLLPKSVRYSSILRELMFASLLTKVDIRLLVTMDGVVSADVLSENGQLVNNNFHEVAHIVLPLRKYFFHFLSDEKYNSLRTKLKLLTHNEVLILDSIRSGMYKEILIRMTNGELSLMELKADKLITVQERLNELFHKGEYAEITLKSEKGKIICANKVNKVRL